jgi:hypothetical protein
MGQLVFQAALGGAVNLIGPNISATTNFTLPGADGTNGQALTTNGSGTLGFSSIVSGAAGSNTQVQFNNGGNFGASSSLTWSGTILTSTGFAGPINGTIGATTANTGNFTTLTTSSTITDNGGTANGVTYLNGSKVVTSGSALTFNGTAVGIGGSTITDGHLLNVQGSTATSNIGIVLNKTNATAQIWGITNTGPLAFYNYTNSSEAMRIGIATGGVGAVGIGYTSLTSVGDNGLAVLGNVGIGTSSPVGKLQVSSSASAGLLIGYNNTSYNYYDANNHIFRAGGGSTYATIDSSGNLGLGVTPSAWSGYKAFEVGSVGSCVWSSGVADVRIAANQYYNAGYKFAGTGYSSYYQQAAGAHIFYSSTASGTAGTTASFTQAMTLGSNGALLLTCTSTPSSTVSGLQLIGAGGGNISSSGSSTTTYNHWIFKNGNDTVGSISTSGSVTTYAVASDYRLKNITGPITTSGAYIDSLNPVEGTWKADGSTFVGLIAHEIQESSRTQVVTGIKDGEEMQAMDYSNSELIANLIAEVKSLRQRVATLEAK